MADLCVGTMPDDMTDFVRQRMESQVFLAEIMDHSLRISNKRQSKVELANEEIRVRGVDSILD
jgi:hypothetical protein